MTPTVAIIDSHRDFAAALCEVVELARCAPVALIDVGELAQLPAPPDAIVIRIASHAAIEPSSDVGFDGLAAPRPTLLALASSDAEVAQAERLACDVVLREPQQVRALYDVLTELATTGRIVVPAR